MKILLLWFFGILLLISLSMAEQDQNLCKNQPNSAFCKEENKEFHISRGEEPNPIPISKKLIEPSQKNSSAPYPLLSNRERELAIKYIKEPIQILASDSESKKHHSETRDKRGIYEESEDDLEYIAYKRRRARLMRRLRELDNYERDRSSSSNDIRHYPSSEYSTNPFPYGYSRYRSRYSSYGYPSGYSNGYPRYSSGGYGSGYPNYGYSGYGAAQPFNLGIGSGLNVGGFGISSGFGINVG